MHVNKLTTAATL